MSEEKKNFLRNNGVDIDNAVNYTGDYDLYNELIMDFYNNLSSQISDIETNKNEGDMTNYAILVHALKSNARCLGLNKLATLAYDHELNSKENNIEYINNNYSLLIEEVEQVRNIINNYMNI